MALREKIGSDEAEPEGCGGSTAQDDNEVWPDFHPSDEDLSPGTPDFHRNPKGRGRFSSISLSLVVNRHPVCVTPRS
ncbi:MAG TPA: hypothetical protein VGL00_21695 [Terracidiphilus sp.]